MQKGKCGITKRDRRFKELLLAYMILLDMRWSVYGVSVMMFMAWLSKV